MLAKLERRCTRSLQSSIPKPAIKVLRGTTVTATIRAAGPHYPQLNPHELQPLPESTPSHIATALVAVLPGVPRQVVQPLPTGPVPSPAVTGLATGLLHRPRCSPRCRPGHTRTPVLFHPSSAQDHGAQQELGLSISLTSRLGEPEHCLGVVLRNTVSFWVIAQFRGSCSRVRTRKASR